MNNNVIVGTFHKTGTVWMQTVLRDISRSIGTRNITLSKNQRKWSDQAALDQMFLEFQQELDGESAHGFFFENHSRFPSRQLLDGFKGFVVVRDPRDVVLSSAKYHQRSQEKWLHRPLEKFGGRTYQETILNLPDLDSRIEFELDNAAGQNVDMMISFDLGQQFELVHYEQLMTDETTNFWAELMFRMGLGPQEVEAACDAFRNRSLFSGAEPEKADHVSDSGLIYKWISELSDSSLEKIESRYGQHILALGYQLGRG